MKKKFLIPVIVITVLISGLIAGFFIWTQIYYKPTENAMKYLDPDDKVNVKVNGDINFTPESDIKNTGFIFYPGGKVDEKAYSYLGYRLAEEGYTVIIAKMPLRLAIFNTDAAEDIIDKNTNIDNWVIGGHSLGGSAAAIFTASNPGIIDGIVFLASYPASSSDISEYPITALSITGSKDGIIDKESLVNTKNLLPPETEFMIIEGGNHSQFGDYGLQSGDNPAGIGPDTQHDLVVRNILKFLGRLD